jgi:hypothetical protein
MENTFGENAFTVDLAVQFASTIHTFPEYDLTGEAASFLHDNEAFTVHSEHPIDDDRRQASIDQELDESALQIDHTHKIEGKKALLPTNVETSLQNAPVRQSPADRAQQETVRRGEEKDAIADLPLSEQPDAWAREQQRRDDWDSQQWAIGTADEGVAESVVAGAAEDKTRGHRNGRRGNIGRRASGVGVSSGTLKRPSGRQDQAERITWRRRREQQEGVQSKATGIKDAGCTTSGDDRGKDEASDDRGGASGEKRDSGRQRKRDMLSLWRK